MIPEPSLLKMMLEQPHGIMYVALLIVIILLFRNMGKKDAYLIKISEAISGMRGEMYSNREVQTKSVTLLEMLIYGRTTQKDPP